MKKIIDFFKRLFGFGNNFKNSESKKIEIPITKYGLNGNLESSKLQPTSQVRVIKNHLMANLSITKKEAKNIYGIYSLSKNIYKLRKRGMKIVYNQNTKIYTYEPKV
jgi:hypothetical protein